ncbi:low molecular weight phosphotyrosine protein phosphatase [Aeromicrobium camelliae]|uniref:protein-tyrosine-phosphatase n=1 Tax=Aeromicrobium camelliae TaxID=1538144 RepID=A0A3N6X3B0_9ACTN|nr:low molecular weight protein-tyrosine-phosphatase [Aeromicrobium camelliae]RQN08148.1 low molecular weight phosphotyrosine protein phosphatase [Aeromicrobium camelliae]
MSHDRYRIAVVCLGNICRSPMAHVVLEKKIADAGLDDQVEVVSAGTGGWHTGDPMDPRAAAVLSDAGYDASRHVARTFTTDWYAENDLLLAMDHSNYTDMAALAPTVGDTERLRMFRSFDPEASEDDLEVPDPWFGGDEGFREVMAMIERSTDAIVEQLPELLSTSERG